MTSARHARQWLDPAAALLVVSFAAWPANAVLRTRRPDAQASPAARIQIPARGGVLLNGSLLSLAELRSRLARLHKSPASGVVAQFGASTPLDRILRVAEACAQAGFGRAFFIFSDTEADAAGAARTGTGRPQ